MTGESRDAAELVLDSLMLDLTNRDGTLLASSSAAAGKILEALEAAGFRVFRPDDCMETTECAHCITASAPLDHRMEPFWLVPVEETKEPTDG